MHYIANCTSPMHYIANCTSPMNSRKINHSLLLKPYDSVIQSLYSNIDWQFCYTIANLRSLAGSDSKLWVGSLRLLWVRFLVGWVRSVLYSSKASLLLEVCALYSTLYIPFGLLSRLTSPFDNSSNEGPDCLQRRDIHQNAKIGWDNLKKILWRITRPANSDYTKALIV
jgi:hypothetical protein